MHQKKSEVQIGKESSGVSSDFYPTPPLLYQSSIHQKHTSNYHHNHQQSNHFFPPCPSFVRPQNLTLDSPQSELSSLLSSTAPYKRPLLTQTPSSLSKSPTFNQFPAAPQFKAHDNSFLSVTIAARSAGFRLLHRLKHIRQLRLHLRVVLLLSLPLSYFLVSQPSHSFILDFLSAFTFSAALLFSLKLALPRLPSIRLLLECSFPIKLKTSSSISRPRLPVFWTIGSKRKLEKKGNSGCWVQVYGNGDIYEGEFFRGKCSGSGVYYYNMSGRYEGDWVDGKYDDYGVETWARGSRYRGHYRQGLRHGFGVYRFYTGDVYAGEWSNGQSHGCGVHTCEDGSRYIGEFKWGVKHGLGHYHFRYLKEKGSMVLI